MSKGRGSMVGGQQEGLAIAMKTMTGVPLSQRTPEGCREHNSGAFGSRGAIYSDQGQNSLISWYWIQRSSDLFAGNQDCVSGRLVG